MLFWVLSHLDDLDADFRVFYRIDDMLIQLDGPRFFKLAQRVGAYQGVMAARAMAQENGGSGAQPSAPRQQTQDRKQIEASQGALGVAAPGMFAFAKAPVAEEQ